MVRNRPEAGSRKVLNSQGVVSRRWPLKCAANLHRHKIVISAAALLLRWLFSHSTCWLEGVPLNAHCGVCLFFPECSFCFLREHNFLMWHICTMGTWVHTIYCKGIYQQGVIWIRSLILLQQFEIKLFCVYLPASITAMAFITHFSWVVRSQGQNLYIYYQQLKLL